MSTDGPMVTIRLRDVPVHLRQASTQHFEELLREMQLVLQGMAEGSGRSVPERLIELTAEVRAVYGSFAARQAEQLDEAFDRGAPAVEEVVYTVPAAAVRVVEHLIGVLDEVDDYCRNGAHLLTLATPPALVAYRSWFLGEFPRQASGAAPTSWPSYAGAQGRDRAWRPLNGVTGDSGPTADDGSETAGSQASGG